MKEGITMSGIEKVIQEDVKQIVKLSGKEFRVGKLSLKQNIRLFKLLGNIFATSYKSLVQIDTKGKNAVEDIINILSSLNEDQIAEVIAILLDTEDINFCKDLALEDITEVIVVIAENNDFDKILKNVERVSKAFKKK